jgi:hypothetical protein
MPLNPKPFSLGDKIIKRIFGGKPKVYADVDINQQTDILVDGLERIANRLGAVTSGFSVTQNTLTATQVISSNTYTLQYDLEYAGGGYCYCRNARLDIPAFSFAATLNTSSLTTISIYLVAKRKVVTFADDNVMGGVDGGGLASPLASSDAQVYYSERVELCQNNTLPTLASDEEVICKLCSVAFTKREWLGNIGVYGAYLVYDAVPDIRTLDLIPDPETSSTGLDVIGWLGRLRIYLKKVKAKLDLLYFVNLQPYDILYYNSTNSRFENAPVFDFIRSFAHSYTKMQSWGGGAICTKSTKVSSEFTVYIDGSSNSYILDLEGTANFYSDCFIADIKLKIGAVISTVPTGTIISLKVKSSDQTTGNPPGFTTNFDYLYKPTQTAAELHTQGNSSNSSPYYIYHNDVIVLHKTADKWEILSNPKDARRQLKAVITALTTNSYLEYNGIGGNPSLTSPRTSLANYEVAVTKSYTNKIKLRGTIVLGNTAAGAILTLPAGYRPAKAATFICAKTGAGLSCHVDVDPVTGIVSLVSGTYVGSLANTDQISLETIEFYV